MLAFVRAWMEKAGGLSGPASLPGWLLALGLVLLGLAAGAMLAILTPPIMAAAVLGLAAGITLLANPYYSLLAIVAVITLLPFGAIPVSIGLVPTFLDAALLAFFLGWIGMIVANREERIPSTPLHWPLLVFMGLACTSFILSQGLTQSEVRYFAEMLLALALFFGVVHVVRQEWQVKMLVWALILGGTLAAGIGVVLYYLPRDTTIRLLSTLRVFNYPAGADVLRFINNDPNQAMRATSTSIDPNVLGGLLMVATSLAVPFLFHNNSPSNPGLWLLKRGLLLALLAILGWCLLLTLSRGSWVGLTAALIFIGSSKYRRLWLLLFLLAGAILLLPEAEAYVAHLISGIQLRDKAAAMRLGEYTDAIKLISRYPILGIGFGTSPTIDLYRGVSNVYLLIAEETGLLGLGAYLFTLSALFWHGLRTLRQLTPDLQVTLLGLLAALFGALVAGVFDHYFFNLVFPHMTTLFWLLVGLVMALWRLSNRSDKEKA